MYLLGSGPKPCVGVCQYLKMMNAKQQQSKRFLYQKRSFDGTNAIEVKCADNSKILLL